MHFPTEILTCSLIHRARYQRHIGRHMMLETVAADVLQQILQMRNFGDTSAA